MEDKFGGFVLVSLILGCNDDGLVVYGFVDYEEVILENGCGIIEDEVYCVSDVVIVV